MRYLAEGRDILDPVVSAWPDFDCARVLRSRNHLSEGGPKKFSGGLHLVQPWAAKL